MKLKTATLLALIGSFLLLLPYLAMALNIDSEFIGVENYYKILNVLSTIGSISLIIFFYSLYKNQK